MSGRVLARLEAVVMRYPGISRGSPGLRGLLTRPELWRGLLEDGAPALDGVSLEVRAGRSLGLIGSNGSGKSTALALLAGLLRPREGRVQILGRVCPLLHRESGFHRELTGRENAVLLGALLGESRASMAERLDGVARESGLGAAFDASLKSYSFGMMVRLALSVGAALSPDVLLLDDNAAYLDARFVDWCVRMASAQKRRGAVLVLASHSLEAVEALCDDAVWLADGRVAAAGPAREVVAAYRRSSRDAASSR